MIIEIILLILAIPAGYLIACMANDELVQGRKWFETLIIAGLTAGFGFYIFGNTTIALTCFFIAIVALVSRLKSRDKKLAKKK